MYSSVIAGFLLAAYVLYIAAKNELRTYLGFFLGSAKTASQPSSFTPQQAQSIGGMVGNAAPALGSLNTASASTSDAIGGGMGSMLGGP